MNSGSYKRDKIDIIRDILEVAKVEDSTTKTRIMYKANLSHDQMKYYVRLLTESNLLHYDLHTQRFKTSEKGLRFIEACERFENWIKTITIAYSNVSAATSTSTRVQGGSKTKII
jgi:predicted transcriptional regulator